MAQCIVSAVFDTIPQGIPDQDTKLHSSRLTPPIPYKGLLNDTAIMYTEPAANNAPAMIPPTICLYGGTVAGSGGTGLSNVGVVVAVVVIVVGNNGNGGVIVDSGTAE
ncbi:hypothetical protein RIF29_03867 [Crotalaria pallida]|uniref:Uncharacterized protein n=1 Tax=Crotalaria pallida TaxID=3830 RepID=A0AAN9J1E3_CROPI